MYKDITVIREDFVNGKYTYTIPVDERISSVKEDHIFDENQSVKWNREQVAIHNEKVKQQRHDSFVQSQQLICQMRKDVVAYIMGVYGFSGEISDRIEREVYTEKHSDMYSYFENIDSYAEFVSDILKIKDGKM